MNHLPEFSNLSDSELFARLGTTPNGLSSEEARKRGSDFCITASILQKPERDKTI